MTPLERLTKLMAVGLVLAQIRANGGIQAMRACRVQRVGNIYNLDAYRDSRRAGRPQPTRSA